MLVVKSRSLAPAGAALVRGISATSSRALADAEGTGNKYEDFKRAAQQTGDAAKEWISGPSGNRMQGALQAAKSSAEEAYEATKRAAAEVTNTAKQAVQGHKGLPGVQSMDAKGNRTEPESTMGSQFADVLTKEQEEAEEAARQSTAPQPLPLPVPAPADAPHLQAGDNDIKNIQSARAVWAERRPEEAKEAENASRKSQLLDEATTGDNAKEASPRDDKQILPNEFYTRH